MRSPKGTTERTGLYPDTDRANRQVSVFTWRSGLKIFTGKVLSSIHRLKLPYALFMMHRSFGLRLADVLQQLADQCLPLFGQQRFPY